MHKKYYHTKESVAEYIQAAKDYNGKELISQFKKILPAGSDVLELGSGPGTDWEILSDTYQVTGSDDSQEFLNHLQQTYPRGEFLNIDAATIVTDKKFHGIYSNKVLHHLKNEELISSVQKQSDVLHADGIVCHSFWKGKGSEMIKNMFVSYHSEKKIKWFFKDHFDILSISSYAEFEEGDSLLFIGKKKEAKHKK